MRTRNLWLALITVTLLILTAVSAAAQVGRIEGTVKKKGTDEPIAEATVEIVRTDIKGNWTLKTDKKGVFLHAGIPFVGTYTILVSAPGHEPWYATGVRPDREQVKVELGPGDGRKLTIEDLKKAQAAAPAAGGGAAPQVNEAEMKKRQEEFEKERAKVEKHNANVAEVNKLLAAGNQLIQSKDYSGAINSYNEAIKLAPDEHVLFRNLSIALLNRGVNNFNAKQRDQAKQDWIDSVTASGRALTLLEGQMSDPAKANDLKNKTDKIAYLKLKAEAEAFLATQFGDPVHAEAAAKDYQALAEISTDANEKKGHRLKIAQLFFQMGKVPESVAIYQEVLQTDPENLEALYGLGLAYSIEEAKLPEATALWKKFIEKAPDSDKRVADVKAALQSLSISLAPAQDDKSAPKKKKP
jgi:tetratricopeptide (TPR) repeat protein